jgi:hypothetical protein
LRPRKWQAEQGSCLQKPTDGFDGDNVRKAVAAFEMMQGLPADGIVDPEMLARIETPDPVALAKTVFVGTTTDGRAAPSMNHLWPQAPSHCGVPSDWGEFASAGSVNTDQP